MNNFPEVLCISGHFKLLILFVILTDILFFLKLYKCIVLAVNEVPVQRHSEHILIQILYFRQASHSWWYAREFCLFTSGMPCCIQSLVASSLPMPCCAYDGMPYSHFNILDVIVVANSSFSSPYSLSIFLSGGDIKNTQKSRYPLSYWESSTLVQLLVNMWFCSKIT